VGGQSPFGHVHCTAIESSVGLEPTHADHFA
jgi:hypothetical protein